MSGDAASVCGTEVGQRLGSLSVSPHCVFLQVLLLSRLRPQDTCTNMWPLLWTGGMQTDTVNNDLLSCFLNPEAMSKLPSANCCSPSASEALSG